MSTHGKDMLARRGIALAEVWTYHGPPHGPPREPACPPVFTTACSQVRAVLERGAEAQGAVGELCGGRDGRNAAERCLFTRGNIFVVVYISSGHAKPQLVTAWRKEFWSDVAPWDAKLRAGRVRLVNDGMGLRVRLAKKQEVAAEADTRAWRPVWKWSVKRRGVWSGGRMNW